LLGRKNGFLKGISILKKIMWLNMMNAYHSFSNFTVFFGCMYYPTKANNPKAGISDIMIPSLLLTPER